VLGVGAMIAAAIPFSTRTVPDPDTIPMPASTASTPGPVATAPVAGPVPRVAMADPAAEPVHATA